MANKRLNLSKREIDHTKVSSWDPTPLIPALGTGIGVIGLGREKNIKGKRQELRGVWGIESSGFMETGSRPFLV